MTPGFTRADLSADGHETKHYLRSSVLDIVREAGFLWSREHQALRYGWLELAGKGAPTLDFLREQGVLRPDVWQHSKFHGVDRDEAICEELMAANANRPDAAWYARDIHSLLCQDLFNDDLIGVVVYDSFDSIGGQKTILHNLPRLIRFALRQQQRLGECLLIINATANPRDVDESDIENFRLRLSSETGVQILNSALRWGRGGRQIPMVWTALRFGF